MFMFLFDIGKNPNFGLLDRSTDQKKYTGLIRSLGFICHSAEH